MILQKTVRHVNVYQFRFSSRSALFVSGRNAQRQFAVVVPKISPEWLRSNRQALERVNEARNRPIDLGNLVQELETYQALKAQIEQINRDIAKIHSDIDERKKRNEDITSFKGQLKKLKENSNIGDMKESLWDLEENAVVDYLNLQNCHSSSIFEEKLFYSMRREENKCNLKNHEELCLANDLIEFSPNSHTAYYLKNELALLELKLCDFFSSKLLAAGLEIFSNPDFVKSVVAEGSGRDIFNHNDIFALKKYQDFGDRSSCNAVHLVGGASLAAFCGYFSRQMLVSPHLLPSLLFCLGRHYSPQPGPVSGLTSCHQCQALQILGLTASSEHMETQLAALLDLLVNTFSFFPNLTVTESRLQDCETCNSRQFRLDMEVRH